MSYFADVEVVLGEPAIDSILSCQLSPSDNDELARSLGHAIHLRHVRRREMQQGNDTKLNSGDLRSILADWYIEELFYMSREEALDKLIGIFRHQKSFRSRKLALDLDEIKNGQPVVLKSVKLMEPEKCAREKIGEECWNLILETVDRGAMNPGQMRDIAFGLGPRVLGAHIRRTTHLDRADRSEMVRIFGDWYSLSDISSLSDLSTQEAIHILIDLFRRARFFPLAEKLELTLADPDEAQSLSKAKGNGWGTRRGTEEDMEILSDIIKEELVISRNRGLDEELAMAIDKDFFEAYKTWKEDTRYSSTRQQVT